MDEQSLENALATRLLETLHETDRHRRGRLSEGDKVQAPLPLQADRPAADRQLFGARVHRAPHRRGRIARGERLPRQGLEQLGRKTWRRPGPGVLGSHRVARVRSKRDGTIVPGERLAERRALPVLTRNRALWYKADTSRGKQGLFTNTLLPRGGVA